MDKYWTRENRKDSPTGYNKDNFEFIEIKGTYVSLRKNFNWNIFKYVVAWDQWKFGLGYLFKANFFNKSKNLNLVRQKSFGSNHSSITKSVSKNQGELFLINRQLINAWYN